MGESRHDALLESLPHGVLDQVRQRFRVGLGREAVALALEPRAQDVGVFDDPVVDQGERAAAVAVRVRVTLGRGTMRRPTRVADAAAAVQWRLGQKVPQAPDASRQLAGLDPTSVQDRDSGGVVAAIFEPAQALHQNRCRFPRPDVPDDSTHRSRVLCLEFEERFPRDRETEAGEPGEPGAAQGLGRGAPTARLPAASEARGPQLHAGSIHVPLAPFKFEARPRSRALTLPLPIRPHNGLAMVHLARACRAATACPLRSRGRPAASRPRISRRLRRGRVHAPRPRVCR